MIGRILGISFPSYIIYGPASVSRQEETSPITDINSQEEKAYILDIDSDILNKKNNSQNSKSIDKKEPQTDIKNLTEPKDPSGRPLTPQEKKRLEYLKKRDKEVKEHEQAHLAVLGGYARGGAHYQYEVGPDGKRYAVSGEVNFDMSEEQDPRRTIQKMQIIQRAAMAPKDPSAQDRAVKARAAQIERKARRELAEMERKKREEKSSSSEIDNKAHISYTNIKWGSQISSIVAGDISVVGNIVDILV